MSENSKKATAGGPPRSLWRAILVSLPMIFLSLFMTIGGGGLPRRPLQLVSLIMTLALINVVFFMMVFTGKTDRYRAIFFVTMAVLFVVSFISNLLEMRGSMSLSQENMLRGETPFCHMVIPMTIIPAALTRTIIFPGSILGGFANIASMLVLWIGVTLALGRGFCSWGCFFGGLEDGFSRLRRKAVIKKIPHRWSYLPYGVLGAMVLFSAATLSPTYCEWLCPFKAVTEFEAVTSTRILIQTIMFGSLFAGLVVVMPILTKKRTQCGLFCPMGAFQSFTNKVNVFDIRIDRSLCKDCGKCIKSCPTFSLDEASVKRGEARISCTKCGKCIDECPTGAISYHIKGSDPGHAPGRSRMMYLFPAFAFLSVFGGGMIQDGIHRILLLVTTGSMLR